VDAGQHELVTGAVQEGAVRPTQADGRVDSDASGGSKVLLSCITGSYYDVPSPVRGVVTRLDDELAEGAASSDVRDVLGVRPGDLLDAQPHVRDVDARIHLRVVRTQGTVTPDT
jgi:hypothetical protein